MLWTMPADLDLPALEKTDSAFSEHFVESSRAFSFVDEHMFFHSTPAAEMAFAFD